MLQVLKRARLHAFAVAVALAPWAGTHAADDAATYAKVDSLFADFALDKHIPGMVYGIVKDGRLVHVRGIGVQDLESKRPVTPDTLFRIASMSKAFTALTSAPPCANWRKDRTLVGCASASASPVPTPAARTTTMAWA